MELRAQLRALRGRVTAVGNGKLLLATGKRQQITVKAGDEVIFGKYSGSDVKIDNVDYKVLRESDLLAKIG